MGLEVLAQKLISSTAVKALSAELRVIGNNSVANLESLHFGAKAGNNTDGLMA
jgi:hypothetical protein